MESSEQATFQPITEEVKAHYRAIEEERDQLKEELRKLRMNARVFGNTVLALDSYGCENGPHECLHAVAKRFLDKVAE
jgi:hypothetical protein